MQFLLDDMESPLTILILPEGAFTLHLRPRSEHPSSSSDAIETTELMFRVYTDPSPCPRLLSRTSVSKLVATCSNFLGHGRPSSSGVVQCACSKPPVHVVTTAGYQKWPLPRVTSDPSLRCSVNTILSGSRTLTRTWILGQCKCKCALNLTDFRNIGQWFGNFWRV